MLIFFLTYTHAQLYNTRIHRSVWITTPSGLQYHTSLTPKIVRPTIFVAQNENSEPNDTFNGEPERKKHEDIGKENDTMDRMKGGLYEALFGGGAWRMVIYLVVAVAFLLIGYQIRKQEEYGSYVRLPTAES
ncbi:hypothetical protein H311_03183 [Anncaliia algerae PRA109]|uniref:Uncharacterized protein n=1 Tax=Anncaliia algerae PRA339 TaxID=1288291 RepID=A0A059EYU3_9MICR|nr:hypothetical protein H311_03183 [Anncaliia algerae PRA109]KCZ80022.1 hypothetical protein H312_02579 [Anncaliia algerae PRA339]